MSSVLKNRRSISELEFFQNAIALRTELTKFILNDKNVPKSYRLYFALPMKSKLTALMDNITAANTIYPINEHELEHGMIAGDINSRGLYAKCTPIDKADCVAGDLVFHYNGTKISHVGAYIGDGQTI